MSVTPGVILVDDDPEVLDAYRQTFELDGFAVTAAGSADSVLAALSPDLAAVVVSDVRMPGRDGFGVLEAVQAIDQDIPVVLVTGHVAFTKVTRGLSRDAISTTLELAHRSLRDFFGIQHPRLAVAALNPHGGEEGIFGDEEKKNIVPAVQAAKRKGVRAYGPFPADSLFYQAARGDYDAVVCMYHDQGLIPLKLHHFFGGVALTLGPPFIRTSVDHGTAYDIAGKGKADASSMKEAILLAATLARRRMNGRTK